MTSPPKYYITVFGPELFLSITPDLKYGDIICYQRFSNGALLIKKYMVRKHQNDSRKIIEQIE